MIRFYLDENVQVAIAEQLNQRGIETITVRDLDLLGETDINHLQNATKMGCVICTHDADYLRLASKGIEHAGIVYGEQNIYSIGDWVNFLELVYSVYSAEEMKNRIEFLR